MRWLYHLAGRGARPEAGPEGFVHGSFAPDVEETRRLYFPTEPRDLWCIDPRRLDARVELADTPRGPMPHIHGAIPDDACARVDAATRDEIETHQIAFVAFPGMTLLDLVGVLDPLARVPGASCEVVSAADPLVFDAHGLRATAARSRPPLTEFDCVVVAGGLATRQLQHDPEVAAWLATYPPNRLAASVCTGALLLGAAGRLRGKRATTNPTAIDLLPGYGATFVDQRVVDDGQLVTAGAVSSAIDLGLHLARRLAGEETARRIADQIAITIRHF